MKLATTTGDFNRFFKTYSPGGNPISEDKLYADSLLKATIRSIEVCGVLGIPNIVVHAGSLLGLSKQESFEK